MKNIQFILLISLFLLLSTSVYAAVVSHPASEITSGTFPAGDFTYQGNVIVNGNVGIGTVTPAQKLSVAGIIESTSGGFKFPDGTIQITAGGGVGSADSGGWTHDRGSVRLTTITDKVGIGTATPGSELEVVGQLKVNSGISDKIVLAGTPTQTGPHTIFLDNSKGIRFWDGV